MSMLVSEDSDFEITHGDSGKVSTFVPFAAVRQIAEDFETPKGVIRAQKFVENNELNRALNDVNEFDDEIKQIEEAAPASEKRNGGVFQEGLLGPKRIPKVGGHHFDGVFTFVNLHISHIVAHLDNRFDRHSRLPI